MNFSDKLTFIIWIFAKFKNSMWKGGTGCTYHVFIFSRRLQSLRRKRYTFFFANSCTFYDRALVYLHFYQLLRTLGAPWEKQRRTERNVRNLLNNFLLCICGKTNQRNLGSLSNITYPRVWVFYSCFIQNVPFNYGLQYRRSSRRRASPNFIEI